MPKIKAPRDPVMELINGRIKTAGVPTKMVAEWLGLSEGHTRVKLKQPSSKWQYGDLQKMCRMLGIPSEEFRQRVSI